MIHPLFPTRRLAVTLLTSWAAFVGVALPIAADEELLRQRGEAIYRSACQSCHGPDGGGTEDHYPLALTGDRSVGELAEVIHATMPEEDPDECVDEDAQAVAAYVHYAFYSEAARIRNRPPRVVLARLTGSQLRQSLADMYARFEGVPSGTAEPGLRGHYFQGRRWNKDQLKTERVDPVLDFDFGHDGPGGDIDPEEFYIHWSGGLKADATGRYELIVRSTCSFVMKFGARDRELINNHVQSGDKTEFRRTLTLTAGRVYPIHIDFTQRKRKTEQPPARFSMSWVRPGGMEEIVPSRNLVANAPPGTFSLQAKLPPDDRSYGYERGIAVSRDWDESTTAAAIEFAAYAADELWPAYRRRHRNAPDENRQRLRDFLAAITETAFRTGLDESLSRQYVDRPVDAEPDDAEAIKRSVLMTLKSPRFLFPSLDFEASPSRRAANRLALTLYDSLPTDDWLLKRVRDDKLRTEQEIREAAVRMVDDERARGKLREMVTQWLGLGEFHELEKDQELYPGFDDALIADLRLSLSATIEELLWGDSGDFRQLFAADWAYTTDRIAAFYGDDWRPAEEGPDRLKRSVPAPGRRFGVLNHPLLMSGLSYHAETSPIHRGVFLIRAILGRTLRPPNDAFSPLSPDLHPDLTTRERVALQTSPDSCQVCHVKINSLGFTLENFDAVGRYRERDGDKPIDASGSYRTRGDAEISFAGVDDLASFLAESDEADLAFVGKLFEFFVKQTPAAYGADRLENLTESFRENDFRVRDLLVEIAVTVATAALEEEA